MIIFLNCSSNLYEMGNKCDSTAEQVYIESNGKYIPTASSCKQFLQKSLGQLHVALEPIVHILAYYKAAAIHDLGNQQFTFQPTTNLAIHCNLLHSLTILFFKNIKLLPTFCKKLTNGSYHYMNKQKKNNCKLTEQKLNIIEF